MKEERGAYVNKMPRERERESFAEIEYGIVLSEVQNVREIVNVL